MVSRNLVCFLCVDAGKRPPSKASEASEASEVPPFPDTSNPPFP